MKIDETYFLNLVKKHKENLSLETMLALFETRKGDCTNVQDCLLMYLLILEHKPRRVVEFSPMLGFSTKYLASALEILGKPQSMFTVEKKLSYAQSCSLRLKCLGLSDYCEVIKGEAVATITREINKRHWAVDFVFIDSDHSKAFAEKYIRNIFPLLSNGCIIVIHDICGENKDVDTYSLDFKSSLNSVSDRYSEYKAVKEFLKKTGKIQHTLTHPLFGGHWGECSWRKSLPQEASPKLPQNKVIYEGFKTIMGYDLRNYLNFQHPNAIIFRK